MNHKADKTVSPPGKLFVVSAPSGAGKTTLIQYVLKHFPALSYSVSSTTRSPRKNEIQGRDYFFISSEEFEKKIEQGDWLEWARVHDNYYGTSRQFVQTCLLKGKFLLLDIDVQGAAQVMASDLDPVTIFILPPSMEVLAQRLENRGTDTRDVIEKRLKNAAAEIEQSKRYQYQLVNDDLDTAISRIIEIFKSHMT
ncbi:MAG: guanylate kinase [Pseudomonadota bacterium]